jgi:uncharacterized LabA/DUF88 family protein
MRDRFSIHVDSGYLIAQAGEGLHGTKSRARLEIDYPGLIDQVIDSAKDAEGLTLLRLYWYDASANGSPEFEQRQVARLPRVKMRLGRLVEDRRSGGLKQKGVDSRIVLDLVKLAYDRAVATAYLLAGDEDLVEGVKMAQETGVRVILLDIPGGSISYQLLQEADDVLRLDEEWLRRNLALRPSIEVLGDGEEVEAPSPPVAVNGSDGEDMETVVDYQARRFAEEWSAEVGDSEVRSLLEQVDESLAREGKWILPPQVDGWLLKASDHSLDGLLQREPGLRRPLRYGFILALHERVGR